LITLTIYGEPASKANSRVPIPRISKDGKPYIQFVRSEKAYKYAKDAQRQISGAARQMLQGPVSVTIRMFYASERPDLDESIVLDVLQARYEGKGEARKLVQRGVYVNDRQVREKHIYHAIDKRNPRCEIEVEPLHPQLVDEDVTDDRVMIGDLSADAVPF
jgi:Holliday junction resolvase RusA-like endonuclease